MALPPGGRVAVIGAGMAGVACARTLADAGHAVQLFDKSRGSGGRMATRRAAWLAGDGATHQTTFDHGAPGFAARAPDFVRVAAQAQRDGVLAYWAPTMAPGSHMPDGEAAWWVATPDMPAWCRQMQAGIAVQTGRAVDALWREPGGWRVACAGTPDAQRFSAVVVAVPPPQAAVLLQAHSPDWAQRLQALPMLPTWTLMGVSTELLAAPLWPLARPAQGPLAWIVRNDAKPGRVPVPGLATWVVHATAAWSQAHLECTADEVSAALQDALGQWLGCTLHWHHAAVHRWRYATVAHPGALPSPAPADAVAGRCWWDAALGLGVCGDAVGGGGVEGAWTSGRAMATALIGQVHPDSAQRITGPQRTT